MWKKYLERLRPGRNTNRARHEYTYKSVALQLRQSAQWKSTFEVVKQY
jgi:hypothetical protein